MGIGQLLSRPHERAERASDEQDVKRWTAKRRAALILEMLRGQNTVADAARTHGVEASNIKWHPAANIPPSTPA